MKLEFWTLVGPGIYSKNTNALWGDLIKIQTSINTSSVGAESICIYIYSTDPESPAFCPLFRHARRSLSVLGIWAWHVNTGNARCDFWFWQEYKKNDNRTTYGEGGGRRRAAKWQMPRYINIRMCVRWFSIWSEVKLYSFHLRKN